MLTAELTDRIRRIEIRTKHAVDEFGAGAYHSVFKGRGIESDGVRSYMPGDDSRIIDWHVTARRGEPFVKTFVEERELTVFLLVDVSASGQFGTGTRLKSEQAAELAALLAFSAVRNNDRVGLLLFSSECELLVPPRKGRRHVLRLVRDLLTWEPRCPGTDIGKALRATMRLARHRSIIFLISDLLDGGLAPVLGRACRHHDLIAVRLLDERELSCPPVGCLAVTDAESAAVALVDTSSAAWRAAYAAEALRRLGAQAEMCRRAGADLIDLGCGEDSVPVLRTFFNARGRGRQRAALRVCSPQLGRRLPDQAGSGREPAPCLAPTGRQADGAGGRRGHACGPGQEWRA